MENKDYVKEEEDVISIGTGWLKGLIKSYIKKTMRNKFGAEPDIYIESFKVSQKKGTITGDISVKFRMKSDDVFKFMPNKAKDIMKGE